MPGRDSEWRNNHDEQYGLAKNWVKVRLTVAINIFLKSLNTNFDLSDKNLLKKVDIH